MGVEEVFLGSKAGIDGERTGRDFLFDILGKGGILSNENFIINIKKIILWKQLLRKLKTAKS
ncbi:MAG: hypothetical protein J6J35_01830 [Alphaproteobacteria bacterium]|nr:hypothetical protein [Alphaproteobacteria bacterium]